MSKKLTEKQFKKLIQSHIDNVDYVKVYHNDNSETSGFIVKFSDEFLMLQDTYDFSLAGTTLIPYEKVNSIRNNEYDKTFKKIYSEEDLLKFDEKIIKKTSLEDFISLFKSIKKQDFHCIVESKKKKTDLFSIGEILEIKEDSLVVKYYHPTGKFSKKPHKISYKNIETITFNDNYSKTFRKYIKHTL